MHRVPSAAGHVPCMACIRGHLSKHADIKDLKLAPQQVRGIGAGILSRMQKQAQAKLLMCDICLRICVVQLCCPTKPPCSPEPTSLMSPSYTRNPPFQRPSHAHLQQLVT